MKPAPKHVRTMARGVGQAWFTQMLPGVEIQIAADAEPDGYVMTVSLIGPEAVATDTVDVPSKRPGAAGRQLLLSVLDQYKERLAEQAPSAEPAELLVTLADGQQAKVNLDPVGRFDLIKALNDLRRGTNLSIDEQVIAERQLVSEADPAADA